VDRKTASVAASRPSLMGLVQSCALLGVGLVPVAIAVACAATGEVSSAALASAALAGGICWAAATFALTATYVGNWFHAPVQGMLAGMLFRMGLPLGAIIAANASTAPRGAVVTILGVYLVTLVAETALALRMVPRTTASQTELVGSRESVAS